MSTSQIPDTAAANHRLTPEEELAQLARVDTLRPAVRRIERSPSQLTITFDPDVDRPALENLLADEQRRGSHLMSIVVVEGGAGPELRYRSDDRSHDPLLATLARQFDAAAPAGPVHEHLAIHRTGPGDRARADTAAQSNSGSGARKPRGPRNVAALAGVFAVACLACLLPGLLAGGALAATLGALGADELIFGALAVALAIAAIAVTLVRRTRKSKAGSDGCGC